MSPVMTGHHKRTRWLFFLVTALAGGLLTVNLVWSTRLGSVEKAPPLSAARQPLNRQLEKKVFFDGQRLGHGGQKDDHREGHGGQREGHGGQKDDHREGHGRQREGHGGLTQTGSLVRLSTPHPVHRTPSGREEGLSGRVTPSQSHREGAGEQMDTPTPPGRHRLSRTLTNIDRCMSVSHLTTPTLLTAARHNAQMFMDQYGRVIPPHSLHGYANHCWNTTYKLAMTTNKFKGHMGDMPFNSLRLVYWFADNTRAFVKDRYGDQFNSSTVCVPNIHLLGFERCGTTHLYCLLSTLFNNKTVVQGTKEPFFWAPYNYRPRSPRAQHLAGRYVPTFLPSMDPEIPLEERQGMTAIDGTPYTILSWPRFTSRDPPLVNYCLLPSTLPELLPGSKFIVIMRNPVDMLYSSFWWSFIRDKPLTKLGGQVASNHSRGPEAFHVQAERKIIQLLECINSDPTVRPEDRCALIRDNYMSCMMNKTHMLSECVHNITTRRAHLEAVLERGLYYVHVRRWVETVSRDRIFFTTLERLTQDTPTVLREALQLLGRGPVRPDHLLDSLWGTCQTNHNPQYKKRPALQMEEKTAQMLERFFEPFNKLLATLLQDEQFLWRSSS